MAVRDGAGAVVGICLPLVPTNAASRLACIAMYDSAEDGVRTVEGGTKTVEVAVAAAAPVRGVRGAGGARVVVMRVAVVEGGPAAREREEEEVVGRVREKTEGEEDGLVGRGGVRLADADAWEALISE